MFRYDDVYDGRMDMMMCIMFIMVRYHSH
jgi:hypothetical protein